MKSLRVAGVKLELRRADVKPFVKITETKTHAFVNLPLSDLSITPGQARRIAWWFEDLADELEREGSR